MLKLIKCEFWKLKRKRLLYALMSLSLFFPLILAYMAKAGTGADTTEHYLQTRFDYVYTMMLGYGLVFLLPCLIGIIAAILFFIERDCDTSKNLRTIPVTNTQHYGKNFYALYFQRCILSDKHIVCCVVL